MLTLKGLADKIGNADCLAIDGQRLEIAQPIRIGQLERTRGKLAIGAGRRAPLIQARLVDDTNATADTWGDVYRGCPVDAFAEGQFTAVILREGQGGRGQELGKVEAVTDAAGRQFEIAAGAAGAACTGRDRAVGTEGDVDAAGLKRGDQGNARNLDVAEQEGRHVGGGILDDDDAAVGLFENEIVALDLDVVDRDVGRQVHNVGGVGDIFGLCRLGGGGRLGLLCLDGLAGACVYGNRIGCGLLRLRQDLLAAICGIVVACCCRSALERILDVLELNTDRHRLIPCLIGQTEQGGRYVCNREGRSAI